MEVSIDIFDMSDELKVELNKAIEVAKIDYTKKYDEMNRESGHNYNTTWSNKPVVMDFTFYVWYWKQESRLITVLR